MNNNIWIIIKKELQRVFGDKRLFFTIIIMPGLMIYIMYSLAGTVINNIYSSDNEYVYKIACENIPKFLAREFEQQGYKLEKVVDKVDSYKDKIKNDEIDLLLVFPKNFENEIQNYDVCENKEALMIAMYYNSQDTESYEIFTYAYSVMDKFEDSISNKFDINTGDDNYDLATSKDITIQITSMLMPMLLMMLLFSTCTSIAPDAIAGEKERGTISTLLVTPIKRRELAIGKIISLSIVVFCGGLSSFIGAMLALPSLSSVQENIDSSVYTVSDYCELLTIVVSTVLIMISFTSVISASSKSIKEASTSMAPLTILVAIIGISGMYTSNAIDNKFIFLIPLYNSAQCMNEIFSLKCNLMDCTITVLANLVYTLIMVCILTKMFKSEHIML